MTATAPAERTPPGPVALVTGAARGIGAATARRLAAAGWHVVLADACAPDAALSYPLATPDDLAGAVESAIEAARAGTPVGPTPAVRTQTAGAAPDRAGPVGGPLAPPLPRAMGLVVDVRRPEELRVAVDEVRERFGGLDAAVAAAGAIRGGDPAWRASAVEWDAMLGVNLTGVWNLARAAVPVMLEREPPRRGRFVAVSSAAGLVGMPGLAAYSAAKAGVIGLVRALAAELGDQAITANVVCPGSTRGPMLDASAAIYHLDGAEDLAVHHLLRRLLDPDEVAALVAWLCSAESGAVTGAVMAADGGLTAH